MDTKNITIEYSSALLDIAEVNPSFDIGKLRVAYTGKNRNGTFISKESFERAIPTMFNCPVVANYLREQDQIGSHDGEFVEDKDGETKYVNVTQPVGLVPESAQWHWETVEDNGVIHQYLTTEIVLWKRQEAYEKIKENGVTKQSMEIAVTDGEMLDDYYDIKDFCFTAFCLLGTAEPCFESAALFTFSNDDFKQQYTEMLKDFKLAFSTVNNITAEKEGEKDLKNEKLKELLDKYQVKEEDLTFEYTDLSNEELEAKFVEIYESNDDPEDNPQEEDTDHDDEDPENQDDPEDNTDDESEDFALNSQIREALCDVIYSAEKIEYDWGTSPRYGMVDFDDDTKEVYFYDYSDYKLYGCPFNLDGDDVVVDFKKCKRKKYAIVDYIEGSPEQNFELTGLIDTFNEAYSTLSEKVENTASELERLQAFEKKVLAETRAADEATLFDKFEKQLNESEEFKALKSKASDYSLEDLEKELFVLVGKLNLNFSIDEKKNKPMVGIPSGDNHEDGIDKLYSWKKNEDDE